MPATVGAEGGQITVLTQDNVAIVQSIYDAFNAGDLDRAASVVAEDFELVDIAAGQSFHGPDGFRQWMQGHKTAGPDARVEVTNVVAAGDWVVAEHIGRFTNTGPLMSPAGSLPPTGRKVELQVAELFRLKDGKVTLMRAYLDSATIMRQLGQFP